MARKSKGKEKSKDVISPVEAIQTSIRQHMHRKDEQSNMFICNRNLGLAWEGHSLQSIFPSQSWTAQDRQEISREYRKVLSILIVIDWQGLRTHWFRTHFFCNKSRKDANLPFPMDQLGFLESAKQLFFDWQYAFKPAIIESHETKHVQTIPSSERVPFVEKPQRMGIGSYGEVFKVSIARGYYHIKSQKSRTENWSDVKVVAVKVYHSESSEKDFQDEVKRLDYLKEGYHNCSRIMKHIAAIVHGDTFMIVLPLAELRDLEVFLRGGRQADPDTEGERQIYDFDEKFTALRDEHKLHQALLKECFEISSALVWLHEELRIYGSLDRYLAHMDLKPDNILIDSDEGHPAGKWMISDFGVSLFDKRTNEAASNVHSIRDVGFKATSRADQTVIQRHRGGYSPPEIGMSRIDGRKCDVWSFVCILCDVLAFALHKSQGVHDFRSVRYDQDDNFFASKPSSVNRKLKIDESNTELKQKIDLWLGHQEREPTCAWVPGFVQVIRQGLTADPDKRPDIRFIMEDLGSINPGLARSPRPLGSFDTASWTPHQFPSKFTVPENGESSESRWSKRPSISFVDHDSPFSQEGYVGPPIINPVPEHVLSIRDNSRRHTSVESTSIPTEGASSHPSFSSENGDPNRREERGAYPRPSNSLVAQNLDMTKPSLFVSSGQYSREYIGLSSMNPSPKSKPIAVALHKLGEHVAMLFTDHVCIYPINEGWVGKSALIKLSFNVAWTHIWTARRFFAIGGHAEGQEYIVVHDSQNESFRRHLYFSYNGIPYSQVTLSDAGIAASIYGQHLHLAYLQDESTEIVVRSIDSGLSIKAAEFSSVNNTLCVWATRSAESKAASAATDMVYFYNVNSPQPQMIGKGAYEKAESPSRDIHLIPFPNAEACVIREHDGGMFIARPSLSPGDKPQPKKRAGIPNALAACITFDSRLLCVEHKTLSRRRDINEYQLLVQTSGVHIGKSSKALGSVDRSVDQHTQIAIGLIQGGKQMLVLYSSRGDILTYVQSD